jgi:Lrp/AsnC family leucine-responsive transcriptional regulator
VHHLDRIDCAIIRLLEDNARESFANIGRAVSLSANSVADRVRRLEQHGIIEGYGAQVAATKVGFAITAFILAKSRYTDERFTKAASERREILECFRVTGEYAFVAKAVVNDVSHLEELLQHLEPSSTVLVTLVLLSRSFDRKPVPL